MSEIDTNRAEQMRRFILLSYDFEVVGLIMFETRRMQDRRSRARL